MGKTSGFRRAVRPRTVLIVEDDPTICTSLGGLLEDDGFEVMIARTLERARYILFESRHPASVVVLDLGMPDGDGEALLHALEQRDDRACSVVLLSAMAERAENLAVRYGIPFVGKPFDVNVIAATVSVAFDNDLRPHLRVTSR